MITPDQLNKAFGLPEGVDVEHTYVYRSGEQGIYDFWYQDRAGNYWKYTNAPVGHAHYDPYGGDAFLVPDQPMSHTTPQFYSAEGRKLHMAVPEDMVITKNEAYDPQNHRSVWYGMYSSEDGETRFVYYDTDVKENLDLWVQYMLRLTDAGVRAYRKYASKLFESPHTKDRVVGVMLMLVDQGFFDPLELTDARVEDLTYTDNTIILLSRKIVCDPNLLDFFTSLTSGRSPNDPLFVVDTVHGRNPIGPRHFYSIFKTLKVSPQFLLYWHASHQFSRIVHRLAASGTPVHAVEELAFAELGRALNTVENVTHLVDFKVKETLLRNFAPIEDEEEVSKGLVRAPTDAFGVAQVWSDLSDKRPDEKEFSMWLHATPLHDVSTAEQVEIEEQLAVKQEATAELDNAAEEAPEGADPGDEPEEAEPSGEDDES